MTNKEKEWPTHKLLAVDTEGNGLSVYSPKCQATIVSWWEGNQDSVPGKGGVHRLPKIPSLLRKKLKDPAYTKLFWNAKHDIPLMRKTGLYIAGPIIDCLVMSRAQFPDEKRHGLKQFARKQMQDAYLEETDLIRWMKKNMSKNAHAYGLAPDHIVFPYALKDAQCTYQAYLLLRHFFDRHKQWGILHQEMKFLRCVLDMEEIGVPIDQNRVRAQMREAQDKLRHMKLKLAKLSGNVSFNPNSHDQVRDLIYNGQVMPTRWTAKGKAKVDELSVLKQPTEAGRLVVQWRKLNKAYKTYLVNFASKCDDKSILHPSINQAGARTGRISCSDPNLTNLPRPGESELGRIRSCIVCVDGHRLLFIDFEQLEVRIFADYIQEPHMLTAIREGEDLHGVACRKVFARQLAQGADFDEYRYYAKRLNLAKQYFIGEDKWIDSVLLDTEGKVKLDRIQANNFIKAWDRAHPRFKSWYEGEVLKEISATGGVVNRYGRYMPVPMDTPYVGVNYKVQGTAADLVKEKMIQLREFLKGKKTRMILQVHDEVIFMLHQSEKHIVPQLVSIMEEHKRFSVPITCSVAWGKDWGHKQKYTLPCRP